MIYRWKLTIGSVTTEVHPVYKDDLALDYELESGQRFFRAKLSSKIDFIGDDADKIIEAAFETEFILTIERSTDNGITWSEYYVSHFYKTDCTINEDDKKVSVQPDVKDQYNDVLNGWEKEFNLIELAPAIQPIEMKKRPMFQIWVAGETIVSCLSGGNNFEQDSVDESEGKANSCHFTVTGYEWEFDFTNNPPAGLVEPFHGTFKGYINNPHLSVDTQTFFNSQGVNRIEYKEWWYSGEWHNGLYIYRNSDDVLMWQYEQTGTVGYEPIPTTITFEPALLYLNQVTAERSQITVYGRMVADVDDVTIGGTTYTLYDIPSDDMVANNRNYRKCIGFADFEIRYSERVSLTPTKWGRNDNGNYFLPPDDTNPWYPVGQSQWVNLSLWVLYDTALENYDAAAMKQFTLKDAYPLWSVISVLLREVAPNITHGNSDVYSHYLYGNEAPFGYGYSQTMPFITPKSNILLGEYKIPAMKAPVTLKDIFSMLAKVYGCYWYIDTSNRLVIEHVQWFKNGGTYESGGAGVGVDLTRLQNTRNGKAWAFLTTEYQFTKEDMPARYEYSWMDDVTLPFKGNPINVVSTFVQEGKVEDVTIANFTSDVDYMLLAPDQCSKDGFALLQARDNGENVWALPFVGMSLGVYTYYMQNYYLAMIYLQSVCLTYDMPSWEIEVDGLATTAAGIQRKKKQKVTVPFGNTNPNTMQLVRTNMGDGQYDKISINLSSRMAKVTLKYDTYDNE